MTVIPAGLAELAELAELAGHWGGVDHDQVTEEAVCGEAAGLESVMCCSLQLVVCWRSAVDAWGVNSGGFAAVR